VELSIEQAIRIAQTRSELVASAQAGVIRADAGKVRARSPLYPQVSAFANYQRLVYSQFRGAFANLPSVPGAPNLSSLFTSLPFGTFNTWQMGASLSQNLYTGGRVLASIRLADHNSELADSNLLSVRASTVLDMADAYLQAILTERLVEIAQETVGQSEEILKLTRVGEQVGARPEFEVLRAEVDLQQAKTNLVRSEVDRDTAMLRLKQLLEIPPDQPLKLTEVLGDELDPSVATIAREVAGIPPQSPPKRAAVIQAEELVRIREASVDIAKSQWVPNVSLTSNFSFVAYPPEFLPGNGEFRPDWAIVLGVQLPLFTGLRITGDVKAARADMIEAAAQLRQTEEISRLDAMVSRRQLEAAQSVWETSAGIVLEARRAYELAQLRYEKGASSQLELLSTQIQYQQALVTRATAARELQIARVRVELLPNLPLGLASGLGAAGTAQGAARTVVESAPQAPTTGGLPASAAPGTAAPAATTPGGGGTPGRIGY
jgi:outer membrane protein TolC